ncbi:MAG: KilA-N domain-containing protein [Campylobacterota bacterium]|nr:KilA-N domain-containing protein [Campylobacterota bacterium]
MKELTKVFKGVDIPVEYQDDNNIWFTVSGVSTKFNKKVADWKNQKRVKQLLTMVGKATDIKGNLIKYDAMGRTQIHKDMFVSFARFVSVEFEFASNKIFKR